nr:unnamed protein product [Callosobruchus chinensis]
MFKLESYITPILLSYVNRYISNLKPEDSQVSLWGGDATFHNLELNLQVLEQELQLPFSFVSGSIRELCIHVPWTKLTSEPITITINTIECILNLKGKNPTSDTSTQVKSNKTKKPVGKDVEAPQGYVQLLINKIVSNIRIHCNNLILKYVEEDIVLSMNVKHLKYQSANQKWEAAYTDLSPIEVILRKIITVNDLTLCLDKRNASGKIEVYQEPMLYRCSMTMHLLKHYHSTSAKRASTTRLDIYCNNMEFSMTEQQVPMLLRLLMLLYALQQKKLKPEKETDGQGTSDTAGATDEGENEESWTGWAWSYVSAVLPAPWEEDNTEDLERPGGHTLHFCIYVDKASVTFKVSETSGVERGTLYPQKKMRYNPMLVLKLQGLYTETVIHGMKWFNAMGGIGQAILSPVGLCSCAEVEITDEKYPVNYLEIGSFTNLHKKDSLFDAHAEENKGNKRKYNRSWDYHMTVFTEAVLLERTPAFAFDYLYQLEQLHGELFDARLLRSVAFARLFGPVSPHGGAARGRLPLRLPALLRRPRGHAHARSASATEDEVDALRHFIPSRNVRITLFAPIVELELMDHPFFQPVKGCLLRRKKKVFTTNIPPPAPSNGKPNLPKLTIECQFLDVTMNYPMYVNRLVHATCQLPDAPKKLFDACFTRKIVKVVGLSSRLLIGQKHTTILTPSSLSYTRNAILLPQYWLDPNIPHNEITFESESVTLNATNAKMMVIVTIISKLIMMDSGGATKMINTTTMLLDACKDYGFPYMELYIEGIRYKRVVTNATTTIDMSLGCIKAFIFEKVDSASKAKSKKGIAPEDIQQCFFYRDPKLNPENPSPVKQSSRTKGTEDTPLLTVTFQYPLSPENQRHAPILLFNLQEIRICVDPLLCKWLLYHPRHIVKSGKSDMQLSRKMSKPPITPSASEASGGGGVGGGGSTSDTPRRMGGVIASSQSVHSSLDREPIREGGGGAGGAGGPPPVFSTSSAPGQEEPVDLQEKVYNVLRKWFEVWKGVYLCGDVSQCTVYFPLASLSRSALKEAVECAVNKEQPPELMVITLPFATVRSSHRQQTIKKYLRALPVTVPEHVWTPKSSSLPWTVSVSDLSCYTVQHGNKLTFLKPVSLSATIGLTTKPPKVDSGSGGSTSKGGEIGYLGICVHIDMTPIQVSTSEVQVYLFASCVELDTEERAGALPPKVPEVIPQVVVNKSGSSAVSPSTAHKDNTLDSNSDKSSVLAKKKPDSSADSDSIKLTAWVQWTITRFTIELLSNECNSLPENDLESQQPRLKLVVDAEDIVSSLDLQSVYLKIKSKIGSASVQHFKRSGSKWKPGPFSGTVMRLREDVSSSEQQQQQQQQKQRHDDQGGVSGSGGGFICVTITRASCQHTHTLWGAGAGAGAAQHSKRRNDGNKKAAGAAATTDTAVAMLPQARYITEIVVNVQPIPLSSSSSSSSEPVPLTGGVTSPSTVLLQTVNSQVLPLAYLECQDIRVVMPSVELGSTGAMHDVIIFQKISLAPSAVNPICRTPIRQDIYDQAVHARILNTPGSEVEDRQYQFDLVGMWIATGTWEDIDAVFSPTGSIASPLHSLSENPAVEWNNLDQAGHPYFQPIMNLWNVTERFDISVVAAPAMLYKSSVVVCGHSVEINFVSDIIVNLSLNQIRLVSAILSEFVSLVEPLLLDDTAITRPKIIFPYSRFEPSLDEIDEWEAVTVAAGAAASDIVRDSGIDTSDIKSVRSSSKTALKTFSENSDHQLLYARKHSSVTMVYTAAPVDVLFTAGKIGLSLYQIDDGRPNVYKQRKKKRSYKVDPDDLGYEAEEESAEDKEPKMYKPLVFVCVKQPNVYLSKQAAGRRMQISCYNLNLKLRGPEYLPVGNVPTEEDYPISLLETKCGQPDPNTGILPAFFTLKYVKPANKHGAHLEVDIAKPTKMLCSMSRWSYLLIIRDRLVDTFRRTEKSVAAVEKRESDVSGVPHVKRKANTYARFQEFKETLRSVNSANLKCGQVVFEFKSDAGHEVNLALERITANLTLFNRPEKVSVVCGLHSVTLNVINENFKRILLNPWTVTFNVAMFWESWQTTESNPQIQISVESDCLMLDISPEQIKCVQFVLKDVAEFVSSFPAKKEENVSPHLPPNVTNKTTSDREQHYKDDLRAGAFQFVDANTDNVDELPLPYQPRALTKVRVFPVPYKTGSVGCQEDLLVLCHLEYWSDCRNYYLPYTHFYLSESEVCHLTLPEASPKTVPCMRIDSYFDRSLVPNLTVAFYLTKIELALCSYFDKQLPVKLPDCLKTYTPDFLFPDTQRFLSIVLENLTSYSLCWDTDVLTIEVSSALKCNVLDYMYLTEQSLIDPFTFKMEIKVGPTVAHTLAVSSQMWSQNYRQQQHQQHQQQQPMEEGWDLVVMTRYVVCNDTNMSLRFGQTGTDEAILLPPRCFHLYAWRSQRKKEHLKLALDENGWTRSFSVAKDGLHTISVNSEKNFTVIVTVKSLSATQKQVILSGQLIVSNTLLEHFDLKVVEEVPKNNKESEFKNSPTCIVPGRSNTCSILISNRKNYFLRLRFYGLDSAWTGDIPLREHATDPNLVPLQERGQFLSIWCRVVIQEVNRVKRTLAILWPLFSVKSNLPISSNVHIETPTLNVHLDSVVKGKGQLQQLYCPGTIDHSHQLTFRIDNSDPIASPYVPLNYSLVDHQQFFKKPEINSIEDILNELSEFDKPLWPYFGDELDDIEWIVGEQPLTHVQVKYQTSCQYSCSLLVELLPWCLTVNTLGVPITINLSGVELCKIPHYGIVAPPKLEENFNIGVCSGGTWCYTEPLQLAKSDWSQSFYMPKFTGTIPLEGCIKSPIVCDSHVCMLSVTSTIKNEIKLLKVSSTHVLSNHMAMQVQVMCFAVPDEEGKFDIPVDMDRYCFAVAPHSDKSNSGISVIQWHTLTNKKGKTGNPSSSGSNYALYMSFSIGDSKKCNDHWSCPVRVDKPLLRKSFSLRTTECYSVPVVLTSQDNKGQIYLTLQEDDRPQLFLENTTGATLFVGQATGNYDQLYVWCYRVGNMERTYYTMPGVSEKFPDLPPPPTTSAGASSSASMAAAAAAAAAATDNFGDSIAIACDPESDFNDFHWSNAVNLHHDNDQFVRVANTACSTIVLLESVSQVEISARDIRVRLLMQEITNSTATVTGATDTSSESDSKRIEKIGDLVRCRSDTSIVDATRPAMTAPADTMWMADHRSRRGWSDTELSALSGTAKEMIDCTLPMRDGWTCITFNAFVKSFVLVFVSDVDFDCKEKWELMSLVCDSLVCRAVQTESMKLKVTASDVQLDNQLYARESYDFPVVLIGQEKRRLPKKLITLNVPIESLIEDCDEDALIVFEFCLETWCDKYRKTRVTAVRSVKIVVNPLSCYIEDIYITKLMEYFSTLTPNVLVMLPKQKSEVKLNIPAGSVCVPEVLSLQCAMLAKPLTVRNVLISPISLLLSVHSSIKLYIALDQSPLHFGKFERNRLLTTPYSYHYVDMLSYKVCITMNQRFVVDCRLGHALTMHYLSGAIFGAGWVVGSLELLGSPGGLARAMGTGLRDFVSLPCRGIFVGPMAFLRGITQGSASLMRHITAGTLQSVTKLASSVARNLDRLTLDEEHLKRTEEQRRQRPQGLAQGFMQGLTGLGISLLGAVGGIAHHPLQSMITDGASPRSLAAGVGLGLVGIVTKPLSGPRRLLQGAGWSCLPEPRSYPQAYKVEYAPNSTLKYSWKHVQLLYFICCIFLPTFNGFFLMEMPNLFCSYPDETNLLDNNKERHALSTPAPIGASMLFAIEATSIIDGAVHDAVALILTLDALIIVNLDRDDSLTVLGLANLHVVPRTNDPTVLKLTLAKPPPTQQQQQQQQQPQHGQPAKTEDDFAMEMDPVSRARVADYVKSTVGLANLQDGSACHSEISISPLSSLRLEEVSSDEDTTSFTYYVSPQNRNYFVYLIKLAKLQLHNYTFPVL